MRKISIALGSLVLFFCVVSISAVLFLNDKAYNWIMMDLIAHDVAGPLVSSEGKVRALRDFVHDNVLPVSGEPTRPDTLGIEKLSSGIGWCDQKSRVFMALAKRSGIATRLLFLKDKKGASPHSIAEALLNDRWVIVDPSYGLDLTNKSGDMASEDDIKSDISILRDNKRVKTFALYVPMWGDEEFLSMYYRQPQYIDTKKGSNETVAGILPPVVRRAYLDLVQSAHFFKVKKDYPDEPEYLLYKARNLHLAGRLGRAERLYRGILSRPDCRPAHDRSMFFLALLLRSQGRYSDAVNVLTALVTRPENKSWLPFAFGLRSSLYRKLGEVERSVDDFARCAEFTDAYFN